MERVWHTQEMCRKDSGPYVSCRNPGGRRDCCGLNQYRKLNPKLNTDVVIICLKNRKVLVTLMKPVFSFLPVP